MVVFPGGPIITFVEKVQCRLSSWKANTLNLIGRTILVNSVLHAIPSYSMQTGNIHTSVHNEVEKISRKFLWGSYGNRRKLHPISWERICSPKVHGGLGIRRLKLNNDANMMKLAWQLTVNEEKLWVRVMRNKYNCGMDLLPRMQRRQNCSNTWRGITGVWDKFVDVLT